MSKIIKLTDDEFSRVADILFEVSRDLNFLYDQRRLSGAISEKMHQEIKETGDKNVSKHKED